MANSSVSERGSKVRIAVCVPVLNRGDLARVSFSSLRKQLVGVTAEIYLYDNGSALLLPTLFREITGNFALFISPVSPIGR